MGHTGTPEVVEIFREFRWNVFCYANGRRILER